LTSVALFILVAVSLLLCAATMLLFQLQPEWFFPGFRTLSRSLMNAMTGVTRHLPVPLWELLAALLVFLFFFTFVRMIKKRKPFFQWLAGWFAVFGVGCFLFVFLWGLNHYAPPLSEELNLDVRPSEEQELILATKYYMEQAETYAELIDRDDSGNPVMPEMKSMLKTAGSSFTALEDTYPFFVGGCTAPVKRTYLSSTILSYTGTTGIFICMTGESTVNAQTFSVSQPYTMCHEAAHRYGIAGEDEANYAAFLACEASRNTSFRYSGYYNAFVYCYNALYAVSPKTAQALWNSSNNTLRQDCAAANAHYEPYEGKVQDAAQKVNDTYLKTFSETGVQSYGEAADYLIAHWREIK